MFHLDKYKKFFEQKQFLKVVFFYFLVLIFIMMVSAFLLYNSYKSLKIKDLNAANVSNLSALAENIDNSFNELQYTAFLLSSDKNLYDIFYTENKLEVLDSYKIKAMIDTLVKFKATKNLIDSVYLLHKKSNEVLDISGTLDVDNFYSRTSIYEKYNKKFWMNFKVKTNFFQILDPSSLESIIYNDAPAKRNVIPFVTSNIDSFKSNNILVINISETKLTDLLNKYKLLLSSKLCIINHQGVVFSSTEESLKNAISGDKKFLSKITSAPNNSFEYNINGIKTLVVTYSTDSSKFNDFVYVAFIPYYDINQKLSSIKSITFSIIFFSVIISTIIAYMMSRKIYNPIKNLVSILNKGQSDNFMSGVGEIAFLNHQVKRILTNEDNLKKDLSIALPLVWEQYLTKILINNDFLLDESVKNFIQSNHVSFNYTGFSVSIFELNFSEKYFNIYSREEYTALLKGITELINDILLDDYPIYILSLTKNRLGILVNLPENESLEQISFKLKSVVELFYYDRDLLTIGIGLGRVYSNYIGMNQSYNEAIKALTSLSPLSKDSVKVYSDISIHPDYQYSINEENKLFNYLNGCYKEETLSFINLLIQKIYQGTPSEATIKKFYSSINNTILRIISEKNINLSLLMGKDYIDITSNLEVLSISDLNSYISSLVNKLLSVNNNSTKVDVLQITEYVKEHYHEDIYLEKVAELFNTSDTYLSRLFKETLGVGFHDYLVSLRVAKSKTLLMESDISVTKIGEMIGFNTHSTFFRIFKKFEGVNPTQFRDNNKNR